MKEDKIPCFAILTDEPNELVAPYHDRMPVALANPEVWLDPATALDAVRPLALELYRVRPVSQALNYVREKSLEKIEAI